MEYTKEAVQFLEVIPEEKGWYYVTLFQYYKPSEDYADYFKDWVFYDGEKWDCEEYEYCYICFIHKKELPSCHV